MSVSGQPFRPRGDACAQATVPPGTFPSGPSPRTISATAVHAVHGESKRTHVAHITHRTRPATGRAAAGSRAGRRAGTGIGVAARLHVDRGRGHPRRRAGAGGGARGVAARHPPPPPGRGRQCLARPLRGLGGQRAASPGRGDRGPVRRVQRLPAHPRRAAPPGRRADRRGHGPRAARAAPQRRDHHRGHGQRPGPHLHRAARQDLSASTARSSTTSTCCGSSTGSSRPLGRRIDETSPRVDARLPDGSRVNAIIEPLSLIGPVITIRKFSARAVHGRRPHPVRHGDARDVRLPPRVHRGAPQRVRLRRHGLRQDDDAQRPLVVHPRTTSGSSRSRTRPSSSSARSTSSRSRRGRRTSRARARSRSATCCATRCTCAPTGSSSASAARARRWTCSRP